ncbi:MAG: single-stranded DNA-binding protein, partial [Natronospirillum sp.]
MAKGTVNKVIILGRLGQDPDMKATASGMQVVNLNVATNELGSKDQSGQRGPDQTEWHRCTLFGRQAEVASQYLSKGSLVYLEGRLQTRKWQDQNGNDRYSTEIICNEMQLMGGGQGGQGPSAQQGGYQGGGQQPNSSPFNQPQQAPQQNNRQPNQAPPQGQPQPQQ